MKTLHHLPLFLVLGLIQETISMHKINKQTKPLFESKSVRPTGNLETMDSENKKRLTSYPSTISTLQFSENTIKKQKKSMCPATTLWLLGWTAISYGIYCVSQNLNHQT